MSKPTLYDSDEWIDSVEVIALKQKIRHLEAELAWRIGYAPEVTNWREPSVSLPLPHPPTLHLASMLSAVRNPRGRYGVMVEGRSYGKDDEPFWQQSYYLDSLERRPMGDKLDVLGELHKRFMHSLANNREAFP